jgi:hypothetical protein
MATHTTHTILQGPPEPVPLNSAQLAARKGAEEDRLAKARMAFLEDLWQGVEEAKQVKDAYQACMREGDLEGARAVLLAYKPV